MYYCAVHITKNSLRFVVLKRIIVPCLFLLISFLPHNSFSQSIAPYDEISVTLNVQHIGTLEIPVIIQKEIAYLPVKEIFDFVKIKNSVSPDLDSVSGYFISPRAVFLVDKTTSRITYHGNTFELKPGDLIRSETGLYLKADYFNGVFGIECAFNFRSLTINVSTKIELPAVREMQQEQMRRNLSKLKGEKQADTTIGRSFSWAHLGMADWSVTSTQPIKGAGDTRVNVGTGALLAGGEANLNLLFNSKNSFNWRDQFYRWKYVNNDNKVLRQLTAGKIYVQSTSSVFAPITGVQITNTPTTYKKSFGTYILSNTTKPGWTVELYVNNVLINYTKADASGFFTFEMPMIYGNSAIKLRFYGPWGEEETREQNVSIPFNFVPVGQLEYTVTAGVVENNEKSRFSRGVLNYGLSRRITIGGGAEYLSSVVSGKIMPFTNASIRLGSNILVSGEHIYGVRSKGNINYRLPSNLQFDLTYTSYDRAQTAVRFNYLKEEKAVISMPIKSKSFSAFTRLTFSQFTQQSDKTSPETKNTSAEFLLSGVVAGVSSNLTTNALFTPLFTAQVYSNLSLMFRLPKGIRFTPQLQYQYNNMQFGNVKGEVEKQILKRGYVSFSYSKNFTDHNTSISLGFRYNFSFAQTSVSTVHSDHTAYTTFSAKGSLIYDDHSNNLMFQEQNNLGRGGLIISPFLDINCNGRKDPNEPQAYGLNLKVSGGKMESNYHDTTVWVSGLEPYNNYLVELDKNSFDNVAWQIRKPIINVAIEPNHFKLIEVPVAVVGEVSGVVNVNRNGALKGLGRMIVNVVDAHSKLVARTLTEADGYFSIMGLSPGGYTAKIDEAQLNKLQMTSSPNILFTIKPGKDGDVADGLQFTLNDITTVK